MKMKKERMKKGSSIKSTTVGTVDKSKVTAKAEKAVAVETTNNFPVQKQFSRDDLMRYKLAESQFVNARMTVQLRVHEFEQMKAAWEAKGQQLIAEVNRSKASFEAQDSALKVLRAELGSKYSINFDKISYQEDTGLIHEHHSS